MAVSKACYCGFVIHRFLLVLLDNAITLQGTNVLEDREVRVPFSSVAEGAPKREVSQQIFKYTGTCSAPRWMDLEQGSAFSSVDLVIGLRSTRHV